MKNNKKGFSLILAMGIVIVISLIAYNILEYIIPFGREVKGVENSSKSYYLANSGIEEGLYHINTRLDEKLEGSRSYSGNISHIYNTFSSGTILPPAGEGNSIYDDDDDDGNIDNERNTISQGNPIQLSIGNGYMKDLANFKITFRVPNLDFYGTSVYTVYNPETLSGGTLPIVNWQLTSINNTLNASGSLTSPDIGIITSNDILNSSKTFNDSNILIDHLNGTDLNGYNYILGNFYGDADGVGNCFSVGSGCVLKFSIVNKLELDSNNIGVPYLEWKLDVSNSLNTNNLPLRYTKIESAGKSIGYKRELEIKVPTKTLNQAFDFTVFQ